MTPTEASAALRRSQPQVRGLAQSRAVRPRPLLGSQGLFGAICEREELEQDGFVADLGIVEARGDPRQGAGEGRRHLEVVPPLQRVHMRPITVATGFLTTPSRSSR